MKRLSNEEWKNIFWNMMNLDEEEIEMWGSNWVEVLWLEGNGVDTHEEWVLGYGTECFEDGFKTEEEAMTRLNQLENELL
jgi:hypothetical protein